MHTRLIQTSVHLYVGSVYTRMNCNVNIGMMISTFEISTLYFRFWVLGMVKMFFTVVWVVTPRSLVGRCQRFGGRHRNLFRVKWVRIWMEDIYIGRSRPVGIEKKKKLAQRLCLHSNWCFPTYINFLFPELRSFCPEDGGNTFCRSVGHCQQDHSEDHVRCFTLAKICFQFAHQLHGRYVGMFSLRLFVGMLETVSNKVACLFKWSFIIRQIITVLFSEKYCRSETNNTPTMQMYWNKYETLHVEIASRHVHSFTKFLILCAVRWLSGTEIRR